MKRNALTRYRFSLWRDHQRVGYFIATLEYGLALRDNLQKFPEYTVATAGRVFI